MRPPKTKKVKGPKIVKCNPKINVLPGGFLQSACPCGWSMPETVAQTSGVNTAIVVCQEAIMAHEESMKKEKK